MVSVLFSDILWSGGSFFFFDSDVLMLKYDKTYPYFFAVIAFKCSGKPYHTQYWNAENTSFRTTNSDFYQVLQSQNSIETFLKKNYENKK